MWPGVYRDYTELDLLSGQDEWVQSRVVVPVARGADLPRSTTVHRSDSQTRSVQPPSVTAGNSKGTTQMKQCGTAGGIWITTTRLARQRLPCKTYFCCRWQIQSLPARIKASRWHRYGAHYHTVVTSVTSALDVSLPTLSLTSTPHVHHVL